MNKFRMAKAGINVNEAVDRLCGDVDTYETLLAGYLDCSFYSEMLKHLEKKDAKEAFSSAHALKGVAGNLSLSKVYEAIVPIVEKLRVEDIDVDEYLPTLKEANDKAISAIQDMVDSQK